MGSRLVTGDEDVVYPVIHEVKIHLHHDLVSPSELHLREEEGIKLDRSADLTIHIYQCGGKGFYARYCWSLRSRTLIATTFQQPSSHDINLNKRRAVH